MPDLLEFAPPRAATAPRPADRPDVAAAARPLLAALAAELAAVADEAEAARRKHARWGVPELFFHDPAAQAALIADQAQATPRESLDLADRLDDAHILLAESPAVRTAARGTNGLLAAARRAGAALPAACRLADLLRMPEGEPIRVIHPAAGAGYRLTTTGVATVGQLHVLLADALTGGPARTRLPGPRPTAAAVAAARGGDPFHDRPATPALYRFVRPEGLRADGTLADGFRGSDHWLWGDEPLADLPVRDGERVLLAADPDPAAEWVVAKPLPRVAADIDGFAVMAAGEAEAWLRSRCPAYRPARHGRIRVAA